MNNVIQFPKQKQRVKRFYPPEYDTPEKRAQYDAVKRAVIKNAMKINW